MLCLLFLFALFPWVQGIIHHIFVGTIDGSSLYALELDDEYRVLYMLHNSSASSASPSIVLDRSKLFLFGTKPKDGTISRYAVGEDLSLKHEGTVGIPASCNTTKFNNIKLTSGILSPYNIYGSASTGSCSTLFSTSVSGFHTLRSNEIAGDVRSLAWSPNGRHLHALDFKTNSLLNFYMSDDPTLVDQVDTDLIPNITTARQVIAHPTGHRLYIVTQDTNELVDIAIPDNDRIDAALKPTHHSILPNGTTGGPFYTSSLAISASNTTLWTLSQSSSQAQIAAWKLDAVTGEVKQRVARAGFANLGGGPENGITSMLTAAPFEGSDYVLLTTFPGAMVAVLGLEGAKIKSLGRVLLSQDPGCCGDGVWVN